MTRLRHYRLSTKQTLREIAEKIGITPVTIHDAEVRGILTPRLVVMPEWQGIGIGTAFLRAVQGFRYVGTVGFKRSLRSLTAACGE